MDGSLIQHKSPGQLFVDQIDRAEFLKGWRFITEGYRRQVGPEGEVEIAACTEDGIPLESHYQKVSQDPETIIDFIRRVVDAAHSDAERFEGRPAYAKNGQPIINFEVDTNACPPGENQPTSVFLVAIPDDIRDQLLSDHKIEPADLSYMTSSKGHAWFVKFTERVLERDLSPVWQKQFGEGWFSRSFGMPGVPFTERGRTWVTRLAEGANFTWDHFSRARGYEVTSEDKALNALVPYPAIKPNLNRVDLIEGLLGEGEIAYLAGGKNTGKSTTAVSLALSIATGCPFLGTYRTEQGGVIVVTAEDPEGFTRRVEAYRKRNPGLDQAPLWQVRNAMDLTAETAGQDVQAIIEQADKQGDKVKLVVFDTLRHSIGGSDENSGADMAKLWVTLDYVRKQTGAALLIIHHLGKDESLGLRGHSSLGADADVELHQKDDGGVIRIRHEKQRNRSKGQDLRLVIEVEDIAPDRNGKMVTAPIVREYRPPQGRDPKPETTKRQEIMSKLVELWRENDSPSYLADRVYSEGGLAYSRKEIRDIAIQALNAGFTIDGWTLLAIQRDGGRGKTIRRAKSGGGNDLGL